MHVHGDDRGALPGRQSQQSLADQQGHVELCRGVGHRRAMFLGELQCRPNGVAPQRVSTRIDDYAMQPAADRRVVPEGAGPAVRAKHRVLHGVVGVLVGHAAAAGQSVQLGVVAAEKLLEGTPVAGRVRGQQSGITALVLG